jgi:hypothetical protein
MTQTSNFKPKPIWTPRLFSKSKDWRGECVREVYHHGITIDVTTPGKPKGILRYGR